MDPTSFAVIHILLDMFDHSQISESQLSQFLLELEELNTVKAR